MNAKRDIDVAIPSVRSHVFPLHACILSKRLNLSWKFAHISFEEPVYAVFSQQNDVTAYLTVLRRCNLTRFDRENVICQ